MIYANFAMQIKLKNNWKKDKKALHDDLYSYLSLFTWFNVMTDLKQYDNIHKSDFKKKMQEDHVFKKKNINVTYLNNDENYIFLKKKFKLKH